MSNIIDGIDYGMGYEKTTEPGPDTQALRFGGQWGPLLDASHTQGKLYRRPLRIISQHPGAIPLEPGDELIEGECYLMRDGRLTGPMPCDGHEAFPFGLDGTPDTWHRDGSCWDNSLSRNDIVARFPKVEQMEPEKAKEEKVAIESYSLEHKSTLNAAITLSEAARIAQLPEVIAEVERQRKENEIKVGDWVRHKRDALIFKVAYADDRGRIVRYPDGVYHYGMENLEKIQDHDLIEMLERTTQP